MDRKLKKYNEQNAYLGFMVEDLRARQELIQSMIRKQKNIIRWNEQFINGFKNAVFWTTNYIDDHQQLKIAVNKFLYTYIQNQEAKNGNINPDIRKEYDQQKKYLENSMASLRKRVEIESEIHKQDNQKSMNDNVRLINDIRELRAKVIELERRLQTKKTKRQDDFKKIKGISTQEEIETLQNKKNNQDSEDIRKIRSQIENRRNHIDALVQSIEDAKQEQLQLEQLLQDA